MFYLKHFNLFLIASLFLTIQTLNVQAYDTEKVNAEIKRIKTAEPIFGNNLTLDLSDCQLESNNLHDILASIDINKRNIIQNLSLFNNQIKALPNDLETLLPNLKILTLDNNYLNTFPTTLLFTPTTVERLSLNNNHLTQLPNGFIARLKNLQIILLINNPALKLQPDLLIELSTSPVKTIDITKTAQETDMNEAITKGLQKNTEYNKILLNFLTTIDGNKKKLIPKPNVNIKEIATSYKNALDEINDLQNQIWQLKNEILNKNDIIRNLCLAAFENLNDDALQ